jgi:hypothetical protein
MKPINLRGGRKSDAKINDSFVKRGNMLVVGSHPNSGGEV